MFGGENDWIGLVINLICAWIAVYYMDSGFLPRYVGWRRYTAYLCGAAAYFLLVTFLNYLTAFEGLMGLGYGIVLFGYGCFALKGSKREMLFLSIVWVLLAFFAYYITASVSRLATGSSLAELHNSGFAMHYRSIAATILRLVMAKLVLAAKKGMSGVSGTEELILAGAFFAVFLVVTGIVMLDLGNLSQNDENVLSVAMLFGFLGIIFSLVYFYHRLDVKNKERMVEEFDRFQLMQQRQQLNQLNQVCSELGSFRHDLTGMLDTVSGMIQKGKREEALLCLGRMDVRLRDCPAPDKSTGNEGLDMALLRTNQACRDQEIDFHYAVGGDVGSFDTMDMGILFYNLLGNAVEACGRLEQKENAAIALHVWEKPDGILCRLENTIRESVLESNPNLQSQKPEKLLHGYGLKSIRDIVRDCGGRYTVSEEDGRLLQEIWLPVLRTNKH